MRQAECCGWLEQIVRVVGGLDPPQAVEVAAVRLGDPGLVLVGGL